MIVLSFPILRAFHPATEKDIKSHFSRGNAAKLNGLIDKINKQLNDINQVTRGLKIPLDKATRGQVDSFIEPIIDASFKGAAIATPHLKTFLEIVYDEHKSSPKDKKLIQSFAIEVKYFLDQFADLNPKFRELHKIINDHFESIAAVHGKLIPALRGLGVFTNPEQSKRIQNLSMEGIRHVLHALDDGPAVDNRCLEAAISRAEKLALPHGRPD